MTRRAPALFAAVVLGVTAGCASPGGHGSASPTPAPVATLLIESKGVTMPRSLALRSLAFRPYVPQNVQMLSVALIPPLQVDRQKQHGIAFEYANAGAAFLLSEWPRAGAQVSVLGTADVTPCSAQAYKDDGLMWLSRGDLVMALQPDGAVPAGRIRSEARRVLRAGACGAPGSPTPRSAPSRSRAVSSPRQSAS